MSDRIRISRRRVMQMGIAAPLVAMHAGGANAAETSEASLLTAEIPGDLLGDFKQRAESYCNSPGIGCLGFDTGKYEDIAKVLWAYFAAGVQHAGAVLPAKDEQEGVDNLIDVLEAAYNAPGAGGKSGELIARRTGEWGNVYKHVSNYCAFLCGMKAARLVGIGNKITANAYTTAFKIVRDEMRIWISKMSYRGAPNPWRGGSC